MVSRFKDDASISIIGAANNTNNKGFSEFGDAGQGLGEGNAGSGITTARSLGVNFAKDTKKVQVGGNVQYGYSDNDARRKSSTETFLGEQSSFGASENTSRRKRHDLRVDFRLEWRPGYTYYDYFSAPVAVIRKQTRKMLPDRIPGITPTIR